MGHPTAIFLSKPDPNYKCAICLDIFNDPVSLQKCGHTFCRSCLNSSLNQTGRNCPECRTKVGGNNGIYTVRVIASAIGNCEVRCRNGYIDANGQVIHKNESSENEDDDNVHTQCQWTGKLSEWHLHSMRECPVSLLTCPIDGCSHTCTRSQMKNHIGSPECINAAVSALTKKKQSDFLSAMDSYMKKFSDSQVAKLRKINREMEAMMKCGKEERRLLIKENKKLRDDVKHWKTISRSTIRKKKHCICPVCGASENLTVCDGCHSMVFCDNEECRKSYWPMHKKDCEEIQRKKKLRDDSIACSRRSMDESRVREAGDGEAIPGSERKRKKAKREECRVRTVSTDLDCQ